MSVSLASNCSNMSHTLHVYKVANFVCLQFSAGQVVYSFGAFSLQNSFLLLVMRAVRVNRTVKLQSEQLNSELKVTIKLSREEPQSFSVGSSL